MCAGGTTVLCAPTEDVGRHVTGKSAADDSILVTSAFNGCDREGITSLCSATHVSSPDEAEGS